MSQRQNTDIVRHRRVELDQTASKIPALVTTSEFGIINITGELSVNIHTLRKVERSYQIQFCT